MSITRALMAAAGNAGAAEPTDPQFNYVTMLLTGDGTNGAQNNTFLDSSANNFSITRNGNTTQGSYSPYGSLWSNYFDGTGDYLSVPDGTAFTMGSGDFTLEAWVYVTATSGSQVIFGTSNSAGSAGSMSFVLQAQNSSGFPAVSVGYAGALYAATSSEALVKNQWNHIAGVRNGATVSIYLNGVSRGTLNMAALAITDSTEIVGIGRNGNYNGEYLTGYIASARIVKGSAVYTANFTPPTAPLTAISGTSLLTCQSNRFIDNSTNAFAITVNGNVAVQRFSPFNPTAAYSTATIGGSGYFDGSGDNLTVAGNSAFNLNTSGTAWLVECWFYPSSKKDATIISQAASVWRVNTASSGVVSWVFGTSSSSSTTDQYQVNAWNHFAVCYDGTTYRLYLNGKYQTSGGALPPTDTTSTIYIGRNTDSAAWDFSGYIGGILVAKGASSAIYTSTTTITVPTTPLTAISGTSLLLNYTNAGIPDSAMMNDLETFGNAQVSTSVKKYGTGSLAFDGSDVLVSDAPSTDLCAFGTGDYTIEMWVYFVNASTLGVFYDSRPTSTNGFYPTLYVSSGNIYFYFNSANEGSAAVSTGQWYHLAVCRSSGTVKMFLNGTQSATWADTRAYSNGSGRPYIGGSGYGGGVGDGFNGYIDDLRVTKGYARYTSNFTAPTAAFPTY